MSIMVQIRKNQIEATLKRRLHVLVKESKAAMHVSQKAEEKVKQGYCSIYNWEEIKGNYLKQLKISLIAAISHKLWLCFFMLDLSFSIKTNRKIVPSINETTSLAALRESLCP